MGSVCKVCKRNADKYPNLSFHRFPDGDTEREKWFSSMGIKPIKLSRTSLICSMHFTEDCFRTTVVSERLLLKKGSVPSIPALQMNSKVYKWCGVPLCKNTSITTPNKLFVYVPNKQTVRDEWLKLAKRNPADVLLNSNIYFCEDHFDLPNDMENYMQYHLMGWVSQVRMNPGCIPKNFACQTEKQTRTSDTIKRSYIRKKRKKRKIIALEKCNMVTERSDFEEIASGSSVEQQPVVTQVQHFGNSTHKYVAPMVFNATIKPEPTMTAMSSNNVETVHIKTEVPENFDTEINIKQEPIDDNLIYETNTHRSNELKTNSHYIKQENAVVKLETEVFLDDFSTGDNQFNEQFEYVNTDVKLKTEYNSSVDNFESQAGQFVDSNDSKTSDKIYECEDTGKKPYPCDGCSKYFTNTSDLNSHKQLHVSAKSYQCDECGKTFAHLSILKEHRRIHTGEKPYQCDVCEKCFSRFGNLKRHTLIHTGHREKNNFVEKNKLIRTFYL